METRVQLVTTPVMRTPASSSRPGRDLGHDGRGEEGGVFDDDVVALVLVGDANLAEEGVGGLAHDHGGEELAAEPGAAAGADRGLDDGDLEVRALLAQDVGGGQAARAGADDDNVRLGVSVEVLEVAAGHGARDLRLADGREAEAVPLAEHVLDADAAGVGEARLADGVAVGAVDGLGHGDSGVLRGRDGGRRAHFGSKGGFWFRLGS
ncbi:hypothetical protein NLG97_g8692 [Lecanicillium saksenae]|uniref:Uncharacterized protein n=1 Tax=Lecanicillium saksenae TaxID=468837 RepID=A0ACC1QJT5_9HYPO|nr:hypothetical protein NLG97_g8692 [Lecanicillium saksenae]